MPKQKCFYTDYVGHMVKFYLSTPDGIDLQKVQYSAASISNWSSVQMVFHRLDPMDVELVRNVFRCNTYLPRAVEEYCCKRGADKGEVWKVLNRIFYKIAQVRGLI